ncbi:MAG: hypothetical protein U0353_13030 [Sandaracinus sp.]
MTTRVGARFVCAACRLRGLTRPCPGCGEDRLDLALSTTAPELARRWSQGRLWMAGEPITSWRSWLGSRVAWRIAASQIVVLFVLTATMTLLAEASVDRLAGWAVLAVALVPPYAALLYGVAVVFGALRPIGSLGRLSAVLPRVRLDAHVAPHAVRGTATLRTPLVVRHVLDARSWMPRDDAWLEPCELELDGQTLVLDHAVGSLSWRTRVEGTLELERDESYREATTTVPSWARDVGRTVGIRRHVLGAGTQLLVRGGHVHDGTLGSSREHPLHLEVFER